MKREEIIGIGSYLSDALLGPSITPADLFVKISSLLPGESKVNRKLFGEIWKKKNSENGGKSIPIDQPLNLSRGFNTNSTTEEQLSTYLPEEKILINKDIFRGHLENIDLIKISPQKQKQLMDTLIKESIGLSTNDVLLYYNLLKINQLSQKIISTSEPIADDTNYSEELYKLIVKNFNLTPQNVKKINSGKVLDEEKVIKILAEGIKRKRINPQVLSICLGHKNSKFIEFFNGFITFFISQRGDDVQEIMSYIGLYILFNGISENELHTLELGSNVVAFIRDRIGRVRSVYYVAMLFMHTFNVLLTAQVYEISAKYANSPLDQKLKLEKLYSADNRRQLLITNAMNIATRKVASFKNESLEVLSAYKRFSGNTKDLVTVKDIFNNDYRTWK